jgi:signal transduction histidine kinase
LRIALHELRAPLTTVAYASELLLDSPRPALPAATHRRHLESIHQSAADASSILTLFSRFIEVEHAGEAPQPESLSCDVFRDPRSATPGPETLPNHSLDADPRLVRHLAKTLWELADLQPAPRPVLSAFVPDLNQLTLVFEDPSSLHPLLFPGSATRKSARPRSRSMKPSPLPFILSFRLDILRRALLHLGGTLTDSHPGHPSHFHITLPLHPHPRLPAASTVRSQP